MNINKTPCFLLTTLGWYTFLWVCALETSFFFFKLSSWWFMCFRIGHYSKNISSCILDVLNFTVNNTLLLLVQIITWQYWAGISFFRYQVYVRKKWITANLGNVMEFENKNENPYVNYAVGRKVQVCGITLIFQL